MRGKIAGSITPLRRSVALVGCKRGAGLLGATSPGRWEQVHGVNVYYYRPKRKNLLCHSIQPVFLYGTDSPIKTRGLLTISQPAQRANVTHQACVYLPTLAYHTLLTDHYASMSHRSVQSLFLQLWDWGSGRLQVRAVEHRHYLFRYWIRDDWPALSHRREDYTSAS